GVEPDAATDRAGRGEGRPREAAGGTRRAGRRPGRRDPRLGPGVQRRRDGRHGGVVPEGRRGRDRPAGEGAGRADPDAGREGRPGEAARRAGREALRYRPRRRWAGPGIPGGGPPGAETDRRVGPERPERTAERTAETGRGDVI